MKTSITKLCKRFSKTSLKFKIILLLFLPLQIFSQELLVYEHSVPIEASKKKKVMKDINEWITTQPLTITLKETNPDEVIHMDGFFTFENPVKYEASATYSRMYASQTNGKIAYQLTISIKDNQLIFSINNFKHLPSAKGEHIEFGILTKSNSAPDNLKLDYDSDWCDKVWASMKKISEENAQRFFDQLPSNLVSSR
jgi:hypothetical protein